MARSTRSHFFPRVSARAVPRGWRTPDIEPNRGRPGGDWRRAMRRIRPAQLFLLGRSVEVESLRNGLGWWRRIIGSPRQERDRNDDVQWLGRFPIADPSHSQLNRVTG